MTLRSRLTAAFFAISVVPLSAVTLFSYVSSERALRRAAEQQANDLADGLSRRMQWVTADIERRLNHGWQTAMPTPTGQQAATSAPPRSGPRSEAGRPTPVALPAQAIRQVVGLLLGRASQRAFRRHIREERDRGQRHDRDGHERRRQPGAKRHNLPTLDRRRAPDDRFSARAFPV
jgi:hypothetical protein